MVYNLIKTFSTPRPPLLGNFFFTGILELYKFILYMTISACMNYFTGTLHSRMFKKTSLKVES